MDTDGIVFLYDVTDGTSFENLTERGYEYVQRCRGEGRRFGCVLVGNKVDLLDEGRKREVTKEVVEDWAVKQGVECCEISCFDAEGVEEVVRMMVRSINKERQDARGKRDQERQKKRSLGDTLKSVFKQAK